MKLLLTISFLFLSLNCLSQTNNIGYIKLTYNVSVVYDSNVSIEIMELDEKTYSVIVETHGKNKTIKIKKKVFDEIIEKILKIDNREIIQSFSMGLDGSVTTLLVGDQSFLSYNSITYQVWGLYKSDSKTSLKSFLEAVQFILKVANVEIDDLSE